ncbi:unnamed protein product, partial [marine sediment metagenome]
MKMIVLRADGGGEKGFGHIVRCCRLAAKLEGRGVECVFLSAGDESAIRYIEEHGFDVRRTDGANVLEDLLSISPDLVINDVRDTDADYIGGLKAAGIPVVNFDDCGGGRELADVVFDGNVLPEDNKDDGRLYLGPDYIVLDPVFESYHRRKKEVAERARKIMIMMGGTDPLELTSKVFDALGPVAGQYHISVVAGFGNQRVSKEIKAREGEGVTVLYGVDCLAGPMYEADLGITSGGVCMFEMAAVGTATVALAQAPHEVINAKLLEDRGIVVSVGMG